MKGWMRRVAARDVLDFPGSTGQKGKKQRNRSTLDAKPTSAQTDPAVTYKEPAVGNPLLQSLGHKIA